MSEQITVEIFVKPYVAKYLEKNYGAPVDLSKNKTLRNIFRKYLSKPNFHSDTVFVNLKYANRKSVYVIISEDDFYRYGWELSLTDQVNFSSDVENIIKQRIYDHLLLMPGKIITKKMNKIRETFDFTEDDMSYEAIKKDFYRFRIKNNIMVKLSQNNPKL